jgi:hypothetical protein
VGTQGIQDWHFVVPFIIPMVSLIISISCRVCRMQQTWNIHGNKVSLQSILRDIVEG